MSSRGEIRTFTETQPMHSYARLRADEDGRFDDDDEDEDEDLEKKFLAYKERNDSSTNPIQTSAENKIEVDKVAYTTNPLRAVSSSLSESYSITGVEKKAIKDYLDNSKEKVNLLKEILIDLLLELVIKNVEIANELAINDRTNATKAYNTFNKTDLYDYDLNDFVHHSDRYEDYKEINDIVYKLKFINIIYLILQKNTSQGDTLNEYKEPSFKYKDLIPKELLNGERGFENEAFKTAYQNFRNNYPLSWQNSLPAEEKVASTFQIDHIKDKLKKFIINYNSHQPDVNYKLKNPENGDDIENLKYFLPSTPSILFQNDTRWDSWKMHELVDSEPDKNYIKESFKDKLINIDITISLILINEEFKKDKPDYAKYAKQLLNHIYFAERAITQTATETSKPTTPSAHILTELNKFITNYNNAITDKSLSLNKQGTELSNLQFARKGFINNFNNDTRWNNWRPPKDTKQDPFIQLNMRNILVRINNAISKYNASLNDYLKIYLLEQIAVAQSFISKKLDKEELLKEVNYKLTNFILIYNKLIPDNYTLKDINTLSDIKELKYEFTTVDSTFEKDIKRWDAWGEISKKGINDSMKDPLININNAIKALNKALNKAIKIIDNDDIITKIVKLEKIIDDAIDFIGLIKYIEADAKRIEEATQKFTKGDNVKLTGLSNPALNNIEATVVEYFKNADMWSVSYNDNGSKKESSVRSSKMLKISQTPAQGGKPPTKYKSTGITVSILYEKKKYKRTVYTKDNRKTKYCKIDGEYILLSKMKNLSNKNPQRISPKTRGGLGDDQKYDLTTLLQLGQDTHDSNLKTKIKTYLDNSVGTVNFLKHRLVYKLLEYMNVDVDTNKFNKDSMNVYRVYNLFKNQEKDGLYVYDLKDFQHYTGDKDEKYKEIDNIVYKLKLINIVYLILKNNLSRGDTQKEYKGTKFEYDISSLLKDEGKATESAMDQEKFKEKYKEWVNVNKNKAIVNNTPKSAKGLPSPSPEKQVENSSSVQKTPDEVKFEYAKVKNKLKEFIITYNKCEPKENYQLKEPGEYMDSIENFEFKSNNNSFLSFSKKTTFRNDKRWDDWKHSQGHKATPTKSSINYINTKIQDSLIDIDDAITEAKNAYTTFENNDVKKINNKTDIEKAIIAINSLNRIINSTIEDKIGVKLYNKWKPKAGGNPPTKYKSTGITVSILYEKKKYKRTVYTKDNRKTKYCKINNKYMLLSKLNVIE